jgi:hypothetical protein
MVVFLPQAISRQIAARDTNEDQIKTPSDQFGSTTVRFALLNGHFFGPRHLKMLVAKPDDESPAFLLPIACYFGPNLA